MTRASHYIIRREFRDRRQALETRQDEQFGKTQAELKNIDNRFDGLERQMHAMQHNFDHQSEALQRSFDETNDKLRLLIDRMTRPRSHASSSSRHRSPLRQDHHPSAPRHNDAPVVEDGSSSHYVPSPRQCCNVKL